MIRSLILCGVFCGVAFGIAAKENYGEKEFRTLRISARHTTPRGIGYKNGYTTLEGMFTALLKPQWMTFLDLRGHLFDSGRFAANGGIGLRYLTCSRAYGINAYCDYRDTSHSRYKQVAVGLETLGRVWDVRLNGYLPVGTKQSSFYQAQFDGFQGNYLYVMAKREFAMKGANAEVGLHVDSCKSIPLYFAAGPYYLNGNGAATWGGEIRARAEFFNQVLRLEVNSSYDHFFHWIGQGQISLNYSFGKRKNKKCSCPTRKSFYKRSMQPVDRFEIIPTVTERVRGAAIDPGSGDPFFFVFADNPSSSLVTYESPSVSLATTEPSSSPEKILYISPGDNISSGMDVGINLENSQLFVGTTSPLSLNTTWGTVTVPSFVFKAPVITNIAIVPVITVAE